MTALSIEQTSLLYEKLELWGCDVNIALERFWQDHEFYLKCLKRFTEEPAFSELKNAVEAGRLQEAANAAHTLKGSAATLGITPIVRQAESLVTLLQTDPVPDLSEAMERLDCLHEEYNEKLKTV